jgi:hypothetical protein
MAHFWRGLFLILVCVARCLAQSTEGLITGRILDRLTRAPVPGALIAYEQLRTNTHGEAHSGARGDYYIPLLPPGSYRLRVTDQGYQASEIYNLSLTVAGYLITDFELRPLEDVWERNLYRTSIFRGNTILPFFGPDIDPSYVGTFEPERYTPGQLEPSISELVDPKMIERLPLTGRDVYTALVLQAGVSTDSATRRSLGLSANGQRPSSSEFLLDGIEDNDRS